MEKTIDLAVLIRKLKRKKEEKEREPVFIYCDEIPEGVFIGMKNGDILIGTKKERSAATDVLE